MNADVDISTAVLETPRLILRAWEPGDLADFYEYCSVEGVGEAAGWTHHKNVDESRRILEIFIAERKTFAIVLKESGKVIGSLGLEELRKGYPPEFDRLRGREIGYVLSRDYWGRGLMPEAVARVVLYCFEDENYDFLSSGHFDWNVRSRRVLEKVGFRPFKEMEYRTRYGTTEHGQQLLLTREDWLRSNN
ncbi:MAG: GNAT family N-acetyltransferase [Clostridiaceae bacterium]|nr:GNAT family N-acetyltransferase [Clostridiaceae bacterium]